MSRAQAMTWLDSLIAKTLAKLFPTDHAEFWINQSSLVEGIISPNSRAVRPGLKPLQPHCASGKYACSRQGA